MLLGAWASVGAHVSPPDSAPVDLRGTPECHRRTEPASVRDGQSRCPHEARSGACPAVAGTHVSAPLTAG